MVARIVALIVAGGVGSRLSGLGLPKQYLSVAGKMILERTMDALFSHESITGLHLVVNPMHREYYQHLTSYPGLLGISESGHERVDSVMSGLIGMSMHDPDFVLIHDAVRPFVSHDVLDRVISNLVDGAEGVAPIIKSPDTLLVCDNNKASAVQDRSRVVRVQTPQGFQYKKILEAYHNRKSDVLFTDDVSVAISDGKEVMLIKGEEKNLKITNQVDLIYTRGLFSEGG